MKTEQYDLPNEEWRDLVSFPQTKGIYFISNLGRYKRIYKSGKVYYSWGAKADGYRNVCLCINHQRIAVPYIHDLVVEAFKRPLKDGEITHHRSGIRDQNNVQNLQIKFNGEHVSGHNKGKVTSQQTKQKLSAAKKGKKRAPFSQQWKRNMSESHKGKHIHSQQNKEKIKKRKDPVTGKFMKQ